MYKVGDFVKVRSYKDLFNEFGSNIIPNGSDFQLSFDPNMQVYSGHIYTVSSIEYDGRDNIQEFFLSHEGRNLRGDIFNWLFNSNMVYPI